MARAKSHIALFHLDYLAVRPTQSSELPALPENAEYACEHVFKKLVKPGDGTVRHPKKMQFTIRKAGRFDNAIICAGCKRKSEKCKARHGSDKLLFVALRKSTPEELKRRPVPPIMGKAAKASQ